jgi:hypothetical protein
MGDDADVSDSESFVLTDMSVPPRRMPDPFRIDRPPLVFRTWRLVP